MKFIRTIVLSGFCVAALGMMSSTIAATAQSSQSTQDTSAASSALKTQGDKLSYALGMSSARAFKANKLPINPELFVRGFNDSFQGKKTLLSEEDVRAVLVNYRKKSLAKLRVAQQQFAEKNKKEGKTFLDNLKKKRGIETLPNGLMYKVVKKGKGESPSLNSVVTVDYEGKFINNKVFDSSYKRGKPATFPVKGVIKGWQVALTKMRPGAVWEIYVPSKLGYGDNGIPGVIPPGSALIFKIHLIKVNK